MFVGGEEHVGRFETPRGLRGLFELGGLFLSGFAFPCPLLLLLNGHETTVPVIVVGVRSTFPTP